ncbi:MAG: trypsin-like peptidase domain-containing protein [bacterium]|nr:S1C family serine protease [bacterium]MBU1918067.1 S1C family serine protease [bacterium]
MTNIASTQTFILDATKQQDTYEFLQEIARRSDDNNEVITEETKTTKQTLPVEITDADLEFPKRKRQKIGIELALEATPEIKIFAKTDDILIQVYENLVARDINLDGQIDKDFLSLDLVINPKTEVLTINGKEAQNLTGIEEQILGHIARYQHSVFAIRVNNIPDGNVEGSGSLISKKTNPEGGFTYTVITNAHVADATYASQITLDESFETSYSLATEDESLTFSDVTLVGTDPLLDIALLKFNSELDLVVPEIGTTQDLKPLMSQVFIFGNSLGEGLRPAFGTVRDENYYGGNGDFPFIRVDPIGIYGNSGGPAFDVSGKMIGVVVQIIPTDIPQKTMFQDLIIIPVERAMKSAEMILADNVHYGSWGTSFKKLSPEERVAMLPAEWNNVGVQITKVSANSAAENAGLQPGDVILAIDGDQSVTAIMDDDHITKVTQVMREMDEGEQSKLTMFRPSDTEKGVFEVLIIAQAETFTPSNTQETNLGLYCQDLTNFVRETHNIPETVQGALVVIDTSSISTNLDNLIIEQVNGKPISNLEELLSTLKELKETGEKGVVLNMYRTHKNWDSTAGSIGAHEYFYVPFKE